MSWLARNGQPPQEVAEQKQLAKILDVSVQRISDYENNRRALSKEKIKILCECFEIDPKRLL